MGKIKSMKQMKDVFQSKIMRGMIISLSVSVVLMLTMAVVMFVFANTTDRTYFSWGFGDGSYEDRLRYSNFIIMCMGIFDIVLALFKFVELFAAFGVYKKYPKSIGFNIIKIIAIVMSVICSAAFAVLFVGAFVLAVTSDQGYKLAAFRSMIVPAIVVFFPTLKFISLSVTVTSVKKQLTNGVLLLIISTAVLIACNFITVVDTLSDIRYYSVISLNVVAVFLVFGVVDLFTFLIARYYAKIQFAEKNQNMDKI